LLYQRCIFAGVETIVELNGIKLEVRSEALEIVVVERSPVLSILTVI